MEKNIKRRSFLGSLTALLLLPITGIAKLHDISKYRVTDTLAAKKLHHQLVEPSMYQRMCKAIEDELGDVFIKVHPDDLTQQQQPQEE